MPRSTKKSVVPSPQTKQQTRGRNDKRSSPSKSPAAKAPAPSPSPAKRSRRSTTQQATPASAKKAQSPSPRPTKNVASPKKSAERGRSTSRAKAKVEEIVTKKGKSTTRSPSKPKTPASSKSSAVSPEPDVSKRARSPRKSAGQSSKSTKSPAKTPKSPAKTSTAGQRSKSKSSNDTVTGISNNKKSPKKSPTKPKSPKTPRSKGKKPSAKQSPNDESVEPVAGDSSELGEGETSLDRPEVNQEAVDAEKSDKKRKREEVDEDGIDKVSLEPAVKVQKTADQNAVPIAENNPVNDTAAGESENTTVTKETVNSHDDAQNNEPSDSNTKEVAATDYENDNEIISKEDVPAADSDEVISAAEKMVPLPEPDVISDSNDKSPVNATADGHNDSDSDVLFSREFLTNPAFDVSTAGADRAFSIVSYNILADVHAQKDFVGDRAPWISDTQLAVSYRHQRLMKEIQYLDADIVCLQEVDGQYLSELLGPAMEALGYKNLFIPRNTTRYCEGEATFYRTSSFSLVAHKEIKLSEIINEEVDASSLDGELKDGVKEALQTYAVAVIVRLKSQATGEEIAVANIHVAYDSLVRPDRRCIQLAMAIRKLVEMADGGVKPHIICGDFNSWPDSAPYQFVKNGQLLDETFEELQAIDDAVALQDGQTAPVVNIWTEGFYFPVVGDLKSSYAVVAGSEPLTSRFAFDGGLRAVDYIWYSSTNLKPIGVLEVVKPQLIEPGVPNAIFPSDHMSLKAKFAFA